MKKLIAILAVAALTGCATTGKSNPTAASPDGSIKVTLLQTPCPFAKDDKSAKEAKVEVQGKDIGVPACWADGEVVGQPDGYLIVIADGRMGMVPKADFK